MKRTPPPRSTVSQYQISRSCRWYRLSALRASVIPIPSRLRKSWCLAPLRRPAVGSCRESCISYSCSFHASQELIPLLAIFNWLSKSPSSNTVETVRWRHFSASLVRAASACCTRCSASKPRISRAARESLKPSTAHSRQLRSNRRTRKRGRENCLKITGSLP